MHTVRYKLSFQGLVTVLQIERLEAGERGAYPKVQQDTGLYCIGLSHVKLHRVLGGMVNLPGIVDVFSLYARYICSIRTGQ